MRLVPFKLVVNSSIIVLMYEENSKGKDRIHLIYRTDFSIEINHFVLISFFNLIKNNYE